LKIQKNSGLVVSAKNIHDSIVIGDVIQLCKDCSEFLVKSFGSSGKRLVDSCKSVSFLTAVYNDLDWTYEPYIMLMILLQVIDGIKLDSIVQ